MRAGYAWLASFLLFPLAGAPLLLHPSFRAFGIPSRTVLAGAVGMVVLSWTMTLSAVAGLSWGPLVFVGAALVSFALRRLLRGSGSPALRPREDRARGRTVAVEALAHGLTAISLLAALAATVAGRSTSADLVLLWGPKAQQFAAAKTVDAAFLTAPFLEYLHVYYPPLVTNVLAWATMVAGRFPWGAATLTFPLLLAATAVGLAGILKAGGPRTAAAGTSALTVSALALLGIHGLVAGNADPFLLFFEILGLALLLTPIAATTAGLLLAGLLLAGAAASKVEGLPFLAAAVALFLLVERHRGRPAVRALALLLVPAAVSIGTWLAFGAIHEVFYGYRSYGRFLDLHWEHLGAVFSGFASAFWKAGYALPFLVPLAVFAATPRKTVRALVPIGVAVALALFFTFTYLHGAADPREWIGWSAARVFSPMTALFALAAWCSRRRGQSGAA